MSDLIAVVDFETEKIKPRPEFPPKPIGLAFLVDGKKDYAPCRTASEKARCKAMLKTWAREGRRFVCHNASFDLDVAETHLGVSWPAYHHDTLILAYLFEPRANTFELKPLYEKLFNKPSTERDKLKEWILENVPKASEAKGENYWAAHIDKAPFQVVKPYAIGDVVRTDKIFRYFWKMLQQDDRMMNAYQRELKLTRVLIKMERRGVPVDAVALKRDLPKMRTQMWDLEKKLFSVLKVPKKQRTDDFAWSGKNFAHRLVDSGVVARLPLTVKGNPSTSAENLAPLLPPKLAQMLELRAQLQTCISTFAENWLRQAEHGGRFYAHYNQVRQDYHGGMGGIVGTTTGRLSMTPNLQNVIRSDKGSLVPRLRQYLVPVRGWKWIKFDYLQQEYRILAHFEEGPLFEQYKLDPNIDFHETVGRLLHELANVKLARPSLKTINFGVLYGMGVWKLSKSLGLDEATTRSVLKAYHSALPGAKTLQKLLTEMAANDEPLYTWGGRRYYCEEPKWIKDKYGNLKEQTYEYRMLNLLIQGSAADATKEAMVRYDATGWNENDKGPLLLQVHDELNAMAAKRIALQAMKVLRECMESLEFDVPLLTDGAWSDTSWDALEKVA